MVQHIGCKLNTDYRDFYDCELASTSYSHELTFTRMKQEALPMEQQVMLLKGAGLKTPPCGPLGDMIRLDIEDAGELASLPGWEQLVEYVIYDDKQLATRISLHDAKTLDPSQFAMGYIPDNPSMLGKVLKYVNFGHLGVWCICWSHDDWRACHGDAHVEIQSGVGVLQPEIARHFTDPLYSIDFIMLNKTPLALNYCRTPNMQSLGLDQHFDAKQVANAIMDRIDTSNVTPENDQDDDEL